MKWLKKLKKYLSKFGKMDLLGSYGKTPVEKEYESEAFRLTVEDLKKYPPNTWIFNDRRALMDGFSSYKHPERKYEILVSYRGELAYVIGLASEFTYKEMQKLYNLFSTDVHEQHTSNLMKKYFSPPNV